MPASTSQQRPRMKSAIKELQAQVPLIFDSVQNSANSKGNMRKHCVQLFQIHDQLSAFQTQGKPGEKPKETGEIKFREAVQGMLARVFTVKKGLPAADRAVCFLGAYTAYINVTDFQYEDDPNGETTAYRFTDSMLQWLMEGLNAKDKNVRSGALKAVSKMLPNLGDIDLDQYGSLEESFTDRIQDKDVAVRESAATCLASLLKTDPELDLEEDNSIRLLLKSMSYDPASDVRKAIIKDIPLTHTTLAAILERTRDTEASVRKYVYDLLRERIAEKVMDGEKVIELQMGPTHPLALSIDQRELIVENGLQDRVPSVNAAAAALLWEWYGAGKECKVEDVDATVKIEENVSGIDTGVDAGLAFVRLFDLGTQPESAEDALASIFKTQKGFADRVTLPDSYWESISPEKVFFVRVLVKHFIDRRKAAKATVEVSQCEDRLDAILPEVTRIAYFIKEQHTRLCQPPNDEKEDELEEETTTIVLKQLLELAVFLDYSDEVGRRRMHSLIRDLLGDLNLSSALMPLCMEVLRLLSSGERDFIRLVVENVTDFRACIDESERAEQQQPAGEESGQALEAAVAVLAKEKISPEVKDEIDGKCLSMCISMLKLVDDPIEKNSTLDYVVEKLIKPRVSEPDGPHVNAALEAMSLCALISEAKATQMLNFAKDKAPNVPLRSRSILYQTLFDIYMVFRFDFFKKSPENLESVPEFLLDRMAVEDDADIKAILCQGVAKLVGAKMVSSDKAFTTLVKFYISPYNSGNAKLQQCLACFFEDYAKSSSFYQEKLCNVFIHVFLDFCEDLKKLEEDEEEVDALSSAQVATMFVDWTDPSHPITRNVHGRQSIDTCVHLDLAYNIVKVLFEKDLRVEIEKDDKRVLCRLLEKLYVPDEVDDCKIRSLAMLLGKLKTLRPLKDSVCRNAVNKFLTAIEKRFAKQLEGISEDELRQLEENQALFDFLDSIIPLDDDDEDETYAAPHRGRKRRSESAATSTPATRSSSPRPSGSQEGSHRNKRPRLSGSTEPDDYEDDSIMRSERSTPMPTVKRPRPKRTAATAASQKDPEVIVISSDSDEGDPPPKRTSKTRLPFRPSVKQEAPLDEDDLDHLLGSGSIEKSNTTFDSIMDSDGTNSEEEVTDLLADDDS